MLSGFADAPSTPLEDVLMEQAARQLAKTSDEPALAYGPLRKAPTYYIGEAIGVNGKSSYGGRALTARRDTERLQNGSLPGKRDKLARRMLRKAFRNAYSKTEQSILKAHDLVNEVRGYGAAKWATSNAKNAAARDGQRNVERLFKAHMPKKIADGRKARQDMRKARHKHKKLWGKAIARMSKAIYEAVQP